MDFDALLPDGAWEAASGLCDATQGVTYTCVMLRTSMALASTLYTKWSHSSVWPGSDDVNCCVVQDEAAQVLQEAEETTEGLKTQVSRALPSALSASLPLSWPFLL